MGAGHLLRGRVAVEEHLTLFDGCDMDLVGVVFHNGATIKTGHYTSLCRGPGGRYWYFNDDRSVKRREEEVAHILPREVYMLVYAKRRQEWSNEEPAPGAVVNLDEDGGGSAT